MLDEIQVIPAKKDEELNRLRVWKVKNENIENRRQAIAKIPYLDHCSWWENNFEKEFIDDRELSWGVNSEGTLVIVLPFMINRNGLVKNTSIQKVGERISQIRKQRGS